MKQGETLLTTRVCGTDLPRLKGSCWAHANSVSELASEVNAPSEQMDVGQKHIETLLNKGADSEDRVTDFMEGESRDVCVLRC